MRNMEILPGPFGTTAEMLALINNVAVREPLRRFAPQRHALFVDNHGDVVLMVRSKESLSVDELIAIRDKECPGTYFFMATSDLYTTEAELQERIDACVQAYAIPPSSAHMEERIVDGKKVLVIDAGPDKTPRGSSH
jgi:hypothetical protein